MFYRDAIVYLLTLAILAFFLRDQIIDIFEALILCCLWPCYLYLAAMFKWESNENGKESEDEESNNLIEEGRLVSQKKSPVSEIAKDESGLAAVSSLMSKTGLEKEYDKESTEFERNESEDVNSSHEKGLPDVEDPYKIVKPIPSSDSKLKSLVRFFLEIPKTLIELFTIVITKIYDITIPVQSSITISLIVLAIFIFLQTRATIYLIEKLSYYTNLSTSFLGMTLISWGNNVGDTINASVAAKLGKVDLLISSILGTQILNLQFCLGFPWLISTLMTQGLQIMVTDDNTFKFFATVFFVVLATILSLTMCSMKLNRISGFFLVVIYLVYITYEFKNNLSIY